MRLHWHTLQCNFNEIEQVFNLHSLFLNVIFYLTNVQGWTIKLKKNKPEGKKGTTNRWEIDEDYRNDDGENELQWEKNRKTRKKEILPVIFYSNISP